MTVAFSALYYRTYYKSLYAIVVQCATYDVEVKDRFETGDVGTGVAVEAHCFAAAARKPHLEIVHPCSNGQH